MYKVTVDGKTVVGCNEDAWRTTSRIWFEKAGDDQLYHAAFTGSRKISNGFVPQSGMNEKGLVFSRLASYYPKQEKSIQGLKSVENEKVYLSNILHSCSNVEEVKALIETYDHSIFIADVFLYIDQTGKYLIVEPYSLTIGEDPDYVLSNFCPSITSNDQKRKLGRFRNGQDFLDANPSVYKPEYFRDLSDTMHVSRKRNGDGTLLTSIWDTDKLSVELYFYHDYENVVRFNLLEEFEKGDHILETPTLFPPNPDFERLASYKTPFNTPALRFAQVFMGGFLLMLSGWLILAFFKQGTPKSVKKGYLIMLGLNLAIFGYLIVLATNQYVFYFDAPYHHYSSMWISISSFVPFLSLILIPIAGYFIMTEKERIKGKFFLGANTLIYTICLIQFAYWGLFSFWV